MTADVKDPLSVEVLAAGEFMAVEYSFKKRYIYVEV